MTISEYQPQPPTAVERGLPYRDFPTGWFHAGWSAEFERGQSYPLRYFGRDLVAYRGESGRLNVFDAYCPHLGAHMGHGGNVCGENLACPFHGWEWSPEGRNVNIPYSGRPNRGQRLAVWPVRETNEMVFLWHDAAGGPPTWEPPTIPGWESGTFYPLYPNCTGEWRNRPMAPQFLAENLADPAHQKYVHESTDVPEMLEFSAEGPLWHSRQRMVWGGRKGSTWMTPGGEKVGYLDIQGWGLGMALFRFEGIDDTVQIQSVIPIDETYSDLRMCNFVPRHTPEAEVPTERERKRIEHLRRQVDNDLRVWEHMRYVTRPPLPPEEAKCYMALRRWAVSFYPDATPPPAAEAAVAEGA